MVKNTTENKQQTGIGLKKFKPGPVCTKFP